jgi:excisionase family DNA binding protein
VSRKTETREAEAAYPIKDAAALYHVSEDTIRRAIHATEPPFLKAKKIGGRIRILASDLQAWFDSLPDA